VARKADEERARAERELHRRAAAKDTRAGAGAAHGGAAEYGEKGPTPCDRSRGGTPVRAGRVTPQ